jgi:hypothetical protein
MTADPDQFEDFTLPDPADLEGMEIELPFVTRGPLTVVNLSGVPLVSITGNPAEFKGSGKALCQAVLAASADLGLGHLETQE